MRIESASNMWHCQLLHLGDFINFTLMLVWLQKFIESKEGLEILPKQY